MVDTVFSFINLALLIGVGWYAFKKIVLPKARKQLEEQKNHEHDLRQDYKVLLEQQESMVRATIEQQALCEALRAKVLLWGNQVKDEQQRHIAQAQEQQRAIGMYTALQQEHYALDQVKSRIQEPLIKSLRHDLETYYKDEHHRRTYMAHIMGSITEDNL